MPKDSDKPEEPYLPSAFEAWHVAEAMRQLMGEMGIGVEKLGLDMAGMAALVPLVTALKAERDRRGLSYRDAAQTLNVRQKDIKAVEIGNPLEVDGKVLVAYAEWLGMGDHLRQWIQTHPAHAAKMSLSAETAADSPSPENVIQMYPDMSPSTAAPEPLAPGEVLPIFGEKDEPAFAGLDLLKKLLSGDPEMEAMIAAEFSKDDDDLLEMFEDDEDDDFDVNKKAAPPAIYELEISLRGVKPRIWRRIHVSNELTLAQLHEVLQRVMGWEDSHLHAFEIFGTRVQGSPTFMAREDSGEDELTGKYRLAHFNLEPKDEIGYEYDFGDSWEHRIVLKQILPPDPAAVPICVKGARGCPPEDIGGPYGYADFLNSLKDPRHPEHQERVEWAEGFDPERFDLWIATGSWTDWRRAGNSIVGMDPTEKLPHQRNTLSD